MHETIAEQWKNSCRPMESHWHILRVERPLCYSYNPYMKPYSLDFRVNANSEICMYLVPFFLISNLAGLQCTFYNIGSFRSRMMWGSSRFAVRNSKKSSWPVTDLWTRRPLNILNGIKLILDDQGNFTWTHIQSVWNHSGPSEAPYSTNQ